MILGNKLPAQCIYFLQLMLIQAFVGLSMELLRLTPVVIACLKQLLGPGLTEEEKTSPWMGLNPLCVPGSLDQAGQLSDLILMFVISMTYNALSPITAFMMAFCFGFAALVYRNQYMFVYDPRNDTGGLFWPFAMKAIIKATVIGELIVTAVLAVKEGQGQAPLMLPIVVVTVLFGR